MFETHYLNAQGKEEVAEFKSKISLVIEDVLKKIPEGRERQIFLTKIEEAMFFGTKAIAAKEDNYEEIIKYDKRARPTKKNINLKKEKK